MQLSTNTTVYKHILYEGNNAYNAIHFMHKAHNIIMHTIPFILCIGYTLIAIMYMHRVYNIIIHKETKMSLI